MSDYENPGRRYKWFRPRDAMRGEFNQGSPTNFATVYLYNNSSGQYYLVVRAIEVAAGAGTVINIAYVQGVVGTAGGTVQRVVPTDAPLAGTLARQDLTPVLTPDFILRCDQQGGAYWQHDFPIAIIPPGWNLGVCNTTSAQGNTVSFLWEAVFPDQLDWFY